MMDKYSADLLYGLGSSPESYLVSPSEILDGDEVRARAAFGSDPVLRRGSCSSAISDAASAMAEEIRRAGEVSGGVRERIASHRLFPELLRAYVDCRKVGAPPEIASELEEIRRENNKLLASCSTSSFAGADSDPELDDFMETYCEILRKCKSDLSRPLEEATSFLSEMQSQLNDLCNINNPGASTTSYVSDELGAGNSSEEELSGGEMEVGDMSSHVLLMANEERELKEKLLRKYSGYIGSLKHEFSMKKKKQGKLPKEARQALLEWWTLHYRWPYPTEGDKIALAELTGLDQKQINNWFINQRKRHWKPPENMHVAFMDAYSLNYTPFYHE